MQATTEHAAVAAEFEEWKGGANKIKRRSKKIKGRAKMLPTNFDKLQLSMLPLLLQNLKRRNNQ